MQIYRNFCFGPFITSQREAYCRLRKVNLKSCDGEIEFLQFSSYKTNQMSKANLVDIDQNI